MDAPLAPDCYTLRFRWRVWAVGRHLDPRVEVAATVVKPVVITAYTVLLMGRLLWEVSAEKRVSLDSCNVSIWWLTQWFLKPSKSSRQTILSFWGCRLLAFAKRGSACNNSINANSPLASLTVWTLRFVQSQRTVGSQRDSKIPCVFELFDHPCHDSWTSLWLGFQTWTSAALKRTTLASHLFLQDMAPCMLNQGGELLQRLFLWCGCERIAMPAEWWSLHPSLHVSRQIAVVW